MDRNQLRNQESRTLGSLDLVMDLVDPFSQGFTERKPNPGRDDQIT